MVFVEFWGMCFWYELMRYKFLFMFVDFVRYKMVGCNYEGIRLFEVYLNYSF